MNTEVTSTRRIRQAIGGFVVIVVGVLVALAGDAWWQDREVAERQLAYLHTLRADLLATATLVNESIKENEQSARQSLEMATTLLAGRSWRETPTSVDPHFATDDVRFRTGTLTALLTTGDINHVASDSLRSALISYTADIDAARNWISRNDGAIWANFHDYVRVEQALFEREAGPELQRKLGDMTPSQAMRQFSPQTLDAYPEIQAAHRLHAIALFNRNELLTAVSTSTRDLLGLLERELGATR